MPESPFFCKKFVRYFFGLRSSWQRKAIDHFEQSRVPRKSTESTDKMPNRELTDIVIILDRSGSMGSVRDATIEALNGYIQSQKTGDGQVCLTLIQFDDCYEVFAHAVPITRFPMLSRKTFEPRGSTALFDAIGRTILETGERYSRMHETVRPGNILIVIQTDGFENASKQYTSEKINEMIAIQRDQYAWQFVFLGANQDAIASGAKLGIDSGASLTYGATRSGSVAAWDVLAQHTGKFRNARKNSNTPVKWEFDETERRLSDGKK